MTSFGSKYNIAPNALYPRFNNIKTHSQNIDSNIPGPTGPSGKQGSTGEEGPSGKQGSTGDEGPSGGKEQVLILNESTPTNFKIEYSLTENIKVWIPCNFNI